MYTIISQNFLNFFHTHTGKLVITYTRGGKTKGGQQNPHFRVLFLSLPQSKTLCQTKIQNGFDDIQEYIQAFCIVLILKIG